MVLLQPLSLLCADQLVGAEHATCFNGIWSDLSHRTSSCKSTIYDITCIQGPIQKSYRGWLFILC